MELDQYVYLNDHEDTEQEYESDLVAQQLAIYPGGLDLCSGTYLIILFQPCLQEECVSQYPIDCHFGNVLDCIIVQLKFPDPGNGNKVFCDHVKIFFF